MEKKFLIGIGIFIVVVIGFAFVVAGNGSSKATVTRTLGARAVPDHIAKALGKIDYNKGIIYHSFPITNSGDKDLEIANIKTSCMCTKAFFRQDGKESAKFGMSTAPSSWKGTIKPGEKGEIVAVFDPQFHGPQGVGEIARSVSLETSDPERPYIEFSFDGTIVK